MVDPLMSNSTVLQDIEANIKNSKELIDLGASVERLKSHRDFKKVIIDGYFKDEAVRLVHLKADPNMQTPDRQASIIRDMDAIGAFASYLNITLVMADRAAQAIEADTLTIAELLEGEEDNG